MSKTAFIVAIVGLAILNGMFSPFLLALALGPVMIIAPAVFASSVGMLFFSSSILLATLTIMLAGVPAALYERFTGLENSTPASMWIWFAGTAIITLSAVFHFLGIGF